MTKGTTDEGVVYHAGFPNAGEDQRFDSLSLDSLVVKRRLSTFFWRLESDIEELHWPKDSIVVIDRSLNPSSGRLVVVADGDGFRLARYQKDHFSSLGGEPIDSEVSVWGVVTYCLQAV